MVGAHVPTEGGRGSTADGCCAKTAEAEGAHASNAREAAARRSSGAVRRAPVQAWAGIRHRQVRTRGEAPIPADTFPVRSRGDLSGSARTLTGPTTATTG